MFIQTKLESYRVSNNREFFQISIPFAIDTVLDAKKFLEKAPAIFRTQSDSGIVDDDDLLNDVFLDSLAFDDEEDPSSEIFLEAEMYYYGMNDTIQDYDEAFNLFQKAARLGSPEAFLRIGQMYQKGEGCQKDNKRALEYYKEGTKLGNNECWAEMARIFYIDHHNSNEEKCWGKYFSSDNFQKFISRTPFYIYNYLRISILENRPILYKDQIIQVRGETLEIINKLAFNRKENGLDNEIEHRCFMTLLGL